LILLYFGTGWLKIIPSLATGGRATPRQTNGWSIKTEEREREREREKLLVVVVVAAWQRQ
jgi:hypothetical protein